MFSPTTIFVLRNSTKKYLYKNLKCQTLFFHDKYKNRSYRGEKRKELLPFSSWTQFVQKLRLRIWVYFYLCFHARQKEPFYVIRFLYSCTLEKYFVLVLCDVISFSILLYNLYFKPLRNTRNQGFKNSISSECWKEGFLRFRIILLPLIYTIIDQIDIMSKVCKVADF